MTRYSLVVFPISKQCVKDPNNETPGEGPIVLVAHEEQLKRHGITIEPSGDQSIVILTY